MKKIKKVKNTILNLFGLKFQIWNVIQGYRLSVDTKTTRYIFKWFKFIGKCETKNLV